MASNGPRPRSSTSGSTASSLRPKSRASTTSVQSVNTQPSHNTQPAPDASFDFPHQNQQQSYPYTPEEMIRQSIQQLKNPHNEFALDPALQDRANHGLPYAPGAGYTVQGGESRPPLEHYQSYDGPDNQMLDPSVDDQGQDGTEADGAKKKKGSASSIANDLELKRLFRENQGRSIKEVAAQVLTNERGPKSEKTKQIFAMLWLNSVCKKSTGSVPRNRVFAHYATRCGTERVPPLNPASFGKLVRIIFPGIQTRRLGMRGESKYHYVDLSLQEDQQDVIDQERVYGKKIVRTSQSFKGALCRSSKSQLPADTAMFPSPGTSFRNTIHFSDSQGNMASGGLFIDSASNSLDRASSRSNMVRRELKFPTIEETPFQENEPIDLPSIHEHTPPGTDPDVADALTALYRSHCVSVIDCIRFCKEKMFFYHYTSFHGTLTVPVQKLLAHPNIAPWIKECDWLMYQKMIRVVAPLTLQVVPKLVIDTLRTISERLGAHISTTFQNHPAHVVNAKLAPATIFAGLLDRLLRVNATAHAAAKLLSNDANRDQMWQDWVLHVKALKVVETTLPNCGYHRVLTILTSEIRELLGPVHTPSYLEAGTIYETDSLASNTANQHGYQAGISPEGVLDRWTNFLCSLPDRFPGADARIILQCVGQVGSAALRDITMAQAYSFGSWWITKVWVDEMVEWLAEKGGFMEHAPTSFSITETGLTLDAASDVFHSRPRTAASSHAESRFSSVDVDLGSAGGSYGANNGGPVQINGSVETAKPAAALSHLQSHDDSGISLGVSDEDLSMAKYSGFVIDGVNVGSDPAGGDVVVC
ncbi:MAG: hypothetical protein M1830_003337 [Pleopsidium flavum]|nr:MAG: hypothetical protein M1830_003337 [Pleopsidium flavum]